MSVGANTEPNVLWHGLLKINTDDRGFNFKFHIAEATEANAIIAANDIAGRFKGLIPMDAEIFYGVLSKDNTFKDGLFLPSALGAGTYAGADVEVPTVYDNARTCVEIRMETTENQPVVRKFAPVPDDVIAGGLVTTGVAPVTGVQVAAPGAAAGGNHWLADFNLFMKSLMFYTHHVKSGHAPGGAYTYHQWKNSYVTRVGVKRGGRVFIG